MAEKKPLRETLKPRGEHKVKKPAPVVDKSKETEVKADATNTDKS